MKIGFDNNKYLKMQSEHIRERINQFGDKLYLEFGGKLFDDYHASRVLPGFAPDSKLRMLLQLADQAEIVIVISAADIEKNKVRSDLGITYDVDVLRLIQSFTDKGLYVGSVVITHYSGQNTADVFKHKLESMGIKVYRHYTIDGYPGRTFSGRIYEINPAACSVFSLISTENVAGYFTKIMQRVPVKISLPRLDSPETDPGEPEVVFRIGMQGTIEIQL